MLQPVVMERGIENKPTSVTVIFFISNPNTINSSPTKITKKINAKFSHYLL